MAVCKVYALSGEDSRLFIKAVNSKVAVKYIVHFLLIFLVDVRLMNLLWDK